MLLVKVVGLVLWCHVSSAGWVGVVVPLVWVCASVGAYASVKDPRIDFNRLILACGACQ